AQSDAAGAATFSLPAGRYEILVDGELGEWGTARRDLELEDGSAAATVALEVPRNPTVAVDASRVRGLRLALTTARQFRRLEPEQIDGKRVPVPAGERAVFRVSGEEDGELLVHFIDVPPQSSGDDRPVVLDWLPVTRVTARLRAPDGSAARGRLRIVRERGNPAFETAEPRTESTEAPVARTRLTGTVDWIAVADDAALAPAYGTVALSEPGATVDLGDVRLAPAGGFSLSVETPAALRDKDLRLAVALRRTNYVSVSMNRAGSDGLLRADLRELSWIGTGEQLELSVDEEPAWLPCVVRIESPPPWRVRWPTAELGLRILDAAGHPLTEAAVIADGTLLPLEPDAAGALRLHGLTAGPHEIVVADRRHRARVLRLIFRDGERRDLEVRLRARN
ncbi:MAG: hypothetical protein JXQ29_13560, partial [Planctomycetes bacterium]|nr:hypothetical protein [Planctomycetota bacterium]